jgi:amidase
MKNITSLILLIFFVLFFSYCKRDKLQGNESEFPLLEIDIERLQQGYRSGEFSVYQVVNLFLDRISAIDENGPGLNSIIRVNPDALQIASLLDQELQQGKWRGPMHGVPVVLKDNIDTYDQMPTTAGSRAMENSFPLHDSFLVRRLREAGAVIIAKANLSEWANFRGELSSSGWSGLGGQTLNPYDFDRNPCGSSSGSAVAVSANLTMIAIGTETNGSIVCPSHANGIVGIKPSVGLISRSGIIPISFSMDIAGPMARTVRDAAIALGAMTGVDSLDQASIQSQGHFFDDYTQFLDPEGLKGKRIGFFTGASGRNYKVDSLMNKAIDALREKGAQIIEISNITSPGAGAASLQVMLFEYRHGLNQYFASLGEDAPIKNIDQLIEFNRQDNQSLKYFNQHYLELASEKSNLDSPEYLKALETMRQASRQEGIDKIMDQHQLHAIAAPTGSPAWFTDLVNGDSFQLGSSSAAAMAGYPNITVPMGFVETLPVGISFFGRQWSEPVLLAIAYSFEQHTMHREPPRFQQD